MKSTDKLSYFFLFTAGVIYLFFACLTNSDPKPFAQFRFNIAGQTWNLSRGEYLVAFLNDTCPDCEAAVAQINDFQKQIPNMPPIIGLCMGEETSLRQFREKTQPHFPLAAIPMTIFLNLSEPRRRVTVISAMEWK